MSDTEVNSEKIRSTKEAAWVKWIGITVSVIQILAGISFVGMMFWIDIFPVKSEITTIVVLILLSGLALYVQFIRFQWARWIGRAVALLLTVVLIIGDVYIYQGKEAMNYVSTNIKTEVISIYVLKSDEAKTIADVKDYMFGYHSVLDRENTDSYIKTINESLNKKISTKQYNDLPEMVEALYTKEIGALILNESYVTTLEDEYPDTTGNLTRLPKNQPLCV